MDAEVLVETQQQPKSQSCVSKRRLTALLHPLVAQEHLSCIRRTAACCLPPVEERSLPTVIRENAAEKIEAMKLSEKPAHRST